MRGYDLDCLCSVLTSGELFSDYSADDVIILIFPFSLLS